jgi:SAM-dependent methyltransferase
MELMPGSPPADFKTRLQQTYDAHAEERDQMGEAGWRWPLCESLITLLKSESKTRLLELGAGAGYASKYFADRGLDVVATDLSPAQVERCRAKGLTAYHRDFYDLGFRMESFDAVWAMNCLLHVPSRDLEDVLSGIRDVLVVGGVFSMGTWGGIAEEGIYEDDFYQPSRFFALRTDEDLVARVGAVFEIEEFQTVVPPDAKDDSLHIQFIRARR